MFLCCLHLEIYILFKLTYTLYCGGVCGGGGAIKALLVCGIAVPEIFGDIREDSR